MSRFFRASPADSTLPAEQSLLQALRRAARPLAGADDATPVLEVLASAGSMPEIVLLGEATHGTSEFYRLRAEISRRLILDHGFDAIAVEADWPDALRVGRWVTTGAGARNADEALGDFQRFPRWMWRNREVRDLLDWLRAHNRARAADRQVGFYGLDLYSLRASMQHVIAYLEQADPDAARQARQRYACFDHLADDPQQYGYASRFGLTDDCEHEVVQQLQDMLARTGACLPGDGLALPDAHFHAQQNARVVRNAERYYRSMFEGGATSWNLRDTHMAETLSELHAHLSLQRGRPARIVVWAHNSHIGDARATEMGRRGELNLGQLVRQNPPAGTRSILLGFTTHTGTVAAASDWDAPVEHKAVKPSRGDSIERLLHRVDLPAYALPLQGELHEPLAEDRLERAIGVIYRPDTERMSHYFQASVSRQFDALVHIDHTTAVAPLDAPWTPVSHTEPETYPTGM